MVFPWQKEHWQQVWQAKEANRLPHALLFKGLAGTGKTHFADYFSSALLCTRDNKSQADHDCSCHSCRLVAGRVHPNLLWITPEEKSSIIKIDQIRKANEFINQSSLQGEYRIVIIHTADQLNISAANALLKTLEEPPSGALIILISNQLTQLPATIVSRCHHIVFPKPPVKLALSWLKNKLPQDAVSAELLLDLANGAPLAALKLIEVEGMASRTHLFQALYSLSQQQGDPIQLAATLQDVESLSLLDFMLSWIIDLLRLQLGCHVQVTNKDYETQLVGLAETTKIQYHIQMMNNIQQLRRQLNEGIHLNKSLLLESLFVQWMNHCR